LPNPKAFWGPKQRALTTIEQERLGVKKSKINE